MRHTLRKLPVLARVGIPITLIAVAIAVVIATVVAADRDGISAKQATRAVVVKTQDPAVYDAAQKILETADIAFDTEHDATRNSYVISVRSDVIQDAGRALGVTGISGRPHTMKPSRCPAPAGFTATRAANERADDCEDAKSIQSMLITAGASAALVEVSRKTNEARPDRESTKSVLAQVYLPSALDGRWPADEVARAVATAIGTQIENVTITDDEYRKLFDGSDSSVPRSKR